MAGQRVDYDALASTYDRRFEASPGDKVSSELLKLLAGMDYGRVLEVGCGTARYLAEFLATVKVGAIGLDFSAGMLAQARRRSERLHLVQGVAEELPFSSSSLNLIYCVNALHHFSDGYRFIAEASRVLHPGGTLGIIGSSPHDPRTDWYVYRYFEGTRAADLDRFKPWEILARWMASRGFSSIEQRPVETIEHKYTGREVLDDPFLKRESTSQLALLSEQAYQDGIDFLKHELDTAEARGERLVFNVAIQIEMLIGRN